MCGTRKLLGCTKTLQQVWNAINKPHPQHQALPRHPQRQGDLRPRRRQAVRRLLLVQGAAGRADAGVRDEPVRRGARTIRPPPGSARATAPAGARTAPWTDITVEHLATHTSGVCDYENSERGLPRREPRLADAPTTRPVGAVRPTSTRATSSPSPGPWRSRTGEPALDPGQHLRVQQRRPQRCSTTSSRTPAVSSLTDIYQTYIRQAGMGSPTAVPLITTDGGRVFNQSTGIIKWNGLDGAAVLRLAGRLGHLGQPERGASAVLEPADPNHRQPRRRRGRWAGAWSTTTTRPTCGPRVAGPPAALARALRPWRQLQQRLPQRPAHEHDRRPPGREQRQGRVLSDHQRLRARAGPAPRRPAPPAPTGATTGTCRAAR